MAIALFDLDNTLLAGDSDYEWGQFMIASGMVDAGEYARRNREFYEQYEAGTLDIHAYASFAYRPLAQTPMEKLRELRDTYMRQCIRPLILPAARELLDEHRRRGDHLVIITSTNRFITEPIAHALGADTLIATDPEIRDGHYTGRIAGIPCFQEGKVERLNQWLEQTGHVIEGSWCYSDSHNDIPLLEAVTHPVAVDPDTPLRRHALQRGWPVITLRQGQRAAALI